MTALGARGVLRGVFAREQDREKPLAIHIADPEGGSRGTLARTSSRRRDGCLMSGCEVEEHLGGSGSPERLMRAKVGVIEECEFDAPFGVRQGERRETGNAEKRFR